MALDFDDLDVAESALNYNSIVEAELEVSRRSQSHSAAELTVKVIGGLSGDELCRVSLSPGNTVRALKASIAQQAQISASEQRLVAGGVQLCDHEVLGDILVSSDEGAAEVAVIRASAARAKVLEDVKNDKVQLQYLEEEHQGDAEIVLAALANDKHALKHAAPAAQQHYAVVLDAVQRHGGNLQYAGESLRENRDIVLVAVQQCGEALLHVPEALRSDRQVVLAAVEQNGLVLQYAPDNSRGEFEVVLAAVEQNGEALRYASREAQRDEKLLMAAIKSSNGEALLHTDKDIRAKRDIVKAAVQLRGMALAFASKELRQDRSMVLLAVQSDGLALKHAGGKLQGDPDIVLQAVSNNGMALHWASEKLRKDKAIALAAMRQDKQAIQYVGSDLMFDESFWIAAADLGIHADHSLDIFLAASVEAAHELHVKGEAVFFDARSWEEWLISRPPGAHCLLMNQRHNAPSMVRVANENPGKTIFTYSDEGIAESRDVSLARKLRSHLPDHQVLRLAGGLNAWKEKGFPVESDPRLNWMAASTRSEFERQIERRKLGLPTQDIQF